MLGVGVQKDLGTKLRMVNILFLVYIPSRALGIDVIVEKHIWLTSFQTRAVDLCEKFLRFGVAVQGFLHKGVCDRHGVVKVQTLAVRVTFWAPHSKERFDVGVFYREIGRKASPSSRPLAYSAHNAVKDF